MNPLKVLFTQGMVTHRTFKNIKNEWVEPNEVFNKNEKLFDSTWEIIVIVWKY